MEQKQREYQIKKKNKRRSRKRITFFLLLCFITIPSLVGCVYFAIRYYTVQSQVQEAWKEIEAEKLEALETSQPTQYSEEQIKELLENAKIEDKEDFLEKLKELMTNGEGTMAMLRYFYPNELIVVDQKKYCFFPISETLKKHSYTDEKFMVDDKNEISYIDSEQTLSQKGIDVSKYQGSIDWAKVKAENVDYAFVRLGLRGYGSGKLVVDETFEQNIKGASDVGINTGAYFVTQSVSVEEAVEEAEFVIETLAPYKDKISYPIALDIEEVLDNTARSANLTKEERTEMAIAFCERIKEAGYQPMLYGNLKSFLIMLDLERLEGYPKWFANYSTPVYYPYEFAIWQYTQSGKINGIKGNVDINVGFYNN